MNLADALAAEHQAYRKGPACSIATCLDALDKSDRAALEAAVADPTVQYALLARALKAIGHPVDAGALSRHRRGECSCGKS